MSNCHDATLVLCHFVIVISTKCYTQREWKLQKVIKSRPIDYKYATYCFVATLFSNLDTFHNIVCERGGEEGASTLYFHILCTAVVQHFVITITINFSSEMMCLMLMYFLNTIAQSGGNVW